MMSQQPVRDWKDQRAGSLTAIKRVGTRIEGCIAWRALWECRCDCGAIVTCTSAELQRKKKRGYGFCARDCLLWRGAA